MGSIEEQLTAFNEGERVLSHVWMVWMALYKQIRETAYL